MDPPSGSEEKAEGKPLPTVVERSYPHMVHTHITAEAIIFPMATATRWRSRVVFDAAGQLAFIAVGDKVDLERGWRSLVDPVALLESEDDLPGLTTIDGKSINDAGDAAHVLDNDDMSFINLLSDIQGPSPGAQSTLPSERTFCAAGNIFKRRCHGESAAEAVEIDAQAAEPVP